MQVIKLNYRTYTKTNGATGYNYSGNSSFPATIVSDVNQREDGSYVTTINIAQDVKLEKVNAEGEVIGVMILPAGNIIAGARGGQYNPEKHVLNGETNFGITTSDDQEGLYFSILPNTLVIGQRVVANFTTTHVAA